MGKDLEMVVFTYRHLGQFGNKLRSPAFVLYWGWAHRIKSTSLYCMFLKILWGCSFQSGRSRPNILDTVCQDYVFFFLGCPALPH
jgi:hypothetical protein